MTPPDADARPLPSNRSGATEAAAAVAAIDALLEERDDLLHEANFAEADRIRRELTERSIVIEDAAGGARWRRLR